MEEAKKKILMVKIQKVKIKKKPVSGVGPKSTGTDAGRYFENLPDRNTNGVYEFIGLKKLKKKVTGQFSQLVLLALPVEKITGSLQVRIRTHSLISKEQISKQTCQKNFWIQRKNQKIQL